MVPRFEPRTSEDDSAWAKFGLWKARMERALQKESSSAIGKRARGVGAFCFARGACAFGKRLPKAEIVANIVAVEDPESGTPYSRLRRLDAWTSEAEKVGMTVGTSRPAPDAQCVRERDAALILASALLRKHGDRREDAGRRAQLTAAHLEEYRVLMRRLGRDFDAEAATDPVLEDLAAFVQEHERLPKNTIRTDAQEDTLYRKNPTARSSWSRRGTIAQKPAEGGLLLSLFYGPWRVPPERAGPFPYIAPLLGPFSGPARHHWQFNDVNTPLN